MSQVDVSGVICSTSMELLRMLRMLRVLRVLRTHGAQSCAWSRVI